VWRNLVKKERSATKVGFAFFSHAAISHALNLVFAKNIIPVPGPLLDV
jgi:hypothetical protein